MTNMCSFYCRPRILLQRFYEQGTCREMAAQIAALPVCSGYSAREEEHLSKALRDSLALHESNIIRSFIKTVQALWFSPQLQTFVKRWPLDPNAREDPQFQLTDAFELWKRLPGTSNSESFALLWFEALSINRRTFIDVNRLLRDHMSPYVEITNLLLGIIIDHQTALCIQNKLNSGSTSWQENEAVPWVDFSLDAVREIRNEWRMSDDLTNTLPHAQFLPNKVDPLKCKPSRGVHKTVPSPRSSRRMALPMPNVAAPAPPNLRRSASPAREIQPESSESTARDNNNPFDT